MVKIEFRKWEDMDIRQLAEMTRETRRYEGLGDYTVDQVEEHLRNMNERFPIESALVAIDDDQILGWMGIERVTEQIGEIGRWQPFVSQRPERSEVAQQLISGVNRHARENGIKRMEIGFGDVSEANSDTFKQRQFWYESEDWNKLEDDYFMVTNPLEEHQVQIPSIPEGIKLKPLSEVDKDKLFLCYHETFMTGQAVWIYEMTEEQRRQEFDKNFDASRPINEKASFVVVQKGEVAGFILVLSRSEEEEHVESFGVHPSFRGKGLAKMMLWKVINVLRQTNSHNLTLGVDSVNSAAISLYELFGFEMVSRTVRYSWKDDA